MLIEKVWRRLVCHVGKRNIKRCIRKRKKDRPIPLGLLMQTKRLLRR